MDKIYFDANPLKLKPFYPNEVINYLPSIAVIVKI